MTGPSSRPAIQAVVLAAGKGTRMRSARPKVLHELLGRCLLERVLDAVCALAPDPLSVVVGHGAEAVRQAVGARGECVLQDPPLGTGDALRRAWPVVSRHPERPVLVVNGDLPLLRAGTVERLVAAHAASGHAATLLTGELEDAGAYGRVLLANGRVERIVEAKDADREQLAVRAFNVGTYVFAVEPLGEALERLTPRNAQGEYYLTDVVAALVAAGHGVGAMGLDDADEGRGVNTLGELALLQERLRRERLAVLLDQGVTLEDPATTWVAETARIEPDAVLRPFTLVEGRSLVRGGAVIGPFARLRDVEVGEGARVLDHCLLEGCAVGPGASIGPFARLRPGTEIGEGARVGNFVELKKTRLGAGSKAPHLSYLGDATIGEGVNVGAGTITCNYDGVVKHPTEIGAGSFVGSNTTLVAPIRVGAGAYVAAGSAITEDVPPDALALGRARQIVKPGWAAARRAARRKKT